MHRPHHHAAVASFLSIFSDYNTSKKRSQFTNQCCFTHSLFPHSGGTNAARREWKNLFLLPFSLFRKPLSPPQGVCEGGADGKERRMYKILIPLENVACPLHLTLRTPSAQYVVIPNTTTVASHQALHTPKHYHSHHHICSCLLNLFDETQITQRKKKKKNICSIYCGYLPFIYLLLCCETEISGAVGAIIHTKLQGHYAMK